MLDNYSPIALIEDARQLKAANPHVLVEASGVRKFFDSCDNVLCAVKAPLARHCYCIVLRLCA